MENTCAPTCAERVTSGGCPICKSSDVGTWRWETATDRFVGSERTRVLAGLGPDSEARDVFLSRIDPLDRSLVEHRLGQLARHPAPFDLEFRITTGRDKRTLRMHGFPDREATPSAPQFFGTIEDMTARLQLSEALVELSLAVEQARDYVCIANAARSIEYVNPAWRERSGRQRPLIGLPVAVLLGDPQIYAEGRAEMDRTGVFRRTIRRVNGHVRHEEITMWPVRDVRGEVTRIVVIASDVSDRIHAGEANARIQEALAGAAREWRHTVDAIDAAIVMFEPPDTIRRMNRAARDLLGELGYDLLGSSIAEFALPAPWPAVLDLVREAGDRGLSCQRQVRDARSEKTWDIVANVAMTEEVGDVVVVIRDVTAILEKETSARRGEVMAATQDLVAGVAHEVGKPLAEITETLDAMESQHSGNAEWLESTATIRREVDRLRTLMQDLVESGGAHVRVESPLAG